MWVQSLVRELRSHLPWAPELKRSPQTTMKDPTCHNEDARSHKRPETAINLKNKNPGIILFFHVSPPALYLFYWWYQTLSMPPVFPVLLAERIQYLLINSSLLSLLVLTHIPQLMVFAFLCFVIAHDNRNK